MRRIPAALLVAIAAISGGASSVIADEGRDERGPTSRDFLIGTLYGDVRDRDEGCHWLTDARGERWAIDWPDGYAVEPTGDDPAALIGPDGSVLARSGERLGVLGAPSGEDGTLCRGRGPVFEVARLAVLPAYGESAAGLCYPGSWKRAFGVLRQAAAEAGDGSPAYAGYNRWSWRWPDGRGRCLGGA